MLELLKLEWLKVKNYRAFWIFLALYIIGLFSINYIAFQLQGEVKKSGAPINIFPYDFPAVYQTIAWVSSWLLYFPGMLMILVITNEYNYKTHRQNIIDGLTRKQFVAAKILFGLVIALLTTVSCFLIALYFGSEYSSSFSFNGIQYIGYSFIQTLCYLFVAMILAVLMRRSGLAMAVFFLYGLVFEQLIGGLIDSKILTNGTTRFYFPLEASDVLIPITFGKEVIYNNAPSQTVLLIVCLVYIFLFVFLSLRKFQTDDL
jgi:ABC-type transport system involved in multi-copper enzyme maturation permease subunit